MEDQKCQEADPIRQEDSAEEKLDCKHLAALVQIANKEIDKEAIEVAYLEDYQDSYQHALLFLKCTFTLVVHYLASCSQLDHQKVIDKTHEKKK